MEGGKVDGYADMLIGYTDDQLAQQLGMVETGGRRFEQVKFEMERLILLAQKRTSDASFRSAIAAARYTKATWFLILVTTIGTIVGIFT
jgi:hypothetical protein